MLLTDGTSPRTRGKQGAAAIMYGAERNIPAHAGKTPMRGKGCSAYQEHPRARGENIVEPALGILSSRNIPAHAGKTKSVCAC